MTEIGKERGERRIVGKMGVKRSHSSSRGNSEGTRRSFAYGNGTASKV